MAEGEHGRAVREHEGAASEHGGAMREHMVETSLSGRAKRQGPEGAEKVKDRRTPVDLNHLQK